MKERREFKPGDLYIASTASYGGDQSYYGYNHIWERQSSGSWVNRGKSAESEAITPSLVFDHDIEWVLGNNTKALWISEGVVKEP